MSVPGVEQWRTVGRARLERESESENESESESKFTLTSVDTLDDECVTCGEQCGIPLNECPKSRRSCGHHCNHTWTHDVCCWCGWEVDEE